MNWHGLSLAPGLLSGENPKILEDPIVGGEGKKSFSQMQSPNAESNLIAEKNGLAAKKQCFGLNSRSNVVGKNDALVFDSNENFRTSISKFHFLRQQGKKRGKGSSNSFFQALLFTCSRSGRLLGFALRSLQGLGMGKEIS